jgi:hypothetical protein
MLLVPGCIRGEWGLNGPWPQAGTPLLLPLFVTSPCFPWVYSKMFLLVTLLSTY